MLVPNLATGWPYLTSMHFYSETHYLQFGNVSMNLCVNWILEQYKL